MKRLLILLFSLPLFVLAQNKSLMVQGVAPGLYVNHTVAPKENYYSIGRIYNISPKEIAPFNNLVLENGLSLGQTVKIPLSTANFIQTGNAAQDEVLVPVYHAVSEKEGLYRISANYNKLPVETLKKWNNLKADVVSNGTNLIVGYLKVKKDLSPLAGMATVKPEDKPTLRDDSNKPVAMAKETVKTEVPDVTPATATLSAPVTEKSETIPDNKKLKKEPVITDVVVKDVSTEKNTTASVKKKNFNGGVFRSDYEKQTHDKDISGETGEAAIFKSTSGWEDGKYYCLHNTSSPGTIVKVTNTSTGKSIYAKVLDTIPDIEQNTGLLIRISNAAAEELGAGNKFDCSLSYSR